jgi:ligand-binding sensor domain-containing protein
VAVDPPCAARGVWAGASGEVWAAGGCGLYTYDAATGVLVQEWSLRDLPLLDVSGDPGSANGPVFACGWGGAMVRWTGTGGWMEEESSTAADLHAVWVSSSSAAWAVGSAGTIIRWQYGTWQQVQKAPWRSAYPELRDVHGNSKNQVYAVGLGGVVARRTFDGLWELVPAPTAADLRGVWVSPAGKVWVAASDGLHVLDNGNWQQVDEGSPHPLRAVWGRSENEIWVADASGGIYHFEHTTP